MKKTLVLTIAISLFSHTQCPAGTVQGIFQPDSNHRNPYVMVNGNEYELIEQRFSLGDIVEVKTIAGIMMLCKKSGADEVCTQIIEPEPLNRPRHHR